VFFANAEWYMYNVLLVMEKVMGITTPPLVLSWIKPLGPIFIGLLNVTAISWVVGTFTALLAGFVLVTVGEFTVKLVVNIELNPLFPRSTTLFTGNVKVYVPKL